jgi:hypothetical protein
LIYIRPKESEMTQPKLPLVASSLKDKSTPEKAAYWREVEAIAAEVEKWPKWKLEGCLGYGDEFILLKSESEK